MKSNMKYEIEGWIARDKDAATPMFFSKEPYRMTRRPFCWVVEGGCYVIRLNPYMFPNLKWEDEPQKAKMTIEITE